MTRGIHRIASVLVVALLATLVPLGAPASAATITVAPPPATLRSVKMLDASTAVAVATNGTIWRSTTAGSDWTQVRTADGYDFRAVDFWNTTKGVAVDYYGKVAQTGDGGATWSNVSFTPYADMDGPSSDYSHQALACIPNEWDYAVSVGGNRTEGYGDAPSTILRSTGNVGFWWWNQPFSAQPHWVDVSGLGDFQWVGEGEFLGVDFVSATHGWAVGRDIYYPASPVPVLYRTTNSGDTWSALTLGHAATLNAVSFGTTTAGITAGQSTADATPRVYYTTNAGTSWTQGTLPAGTGTPRALHMTSATQGWLAGDGGTLLRTTDGGVTWTPCTKPAGFIANLYDIELVGTTGIAVGANTVLTTTDGITWYRPDGTAPTLSAISSTSHPVATTWYSTRTVTASWSASDDSGIAGYAVVLDQNPATVPDQTVTQAGNTFSGTLPADGVWYLHVRARDNAGNWSGAQHRAFRADTAAPTTTSNAAGPYVGSATITLTPTDPAPSSGIAQTSWSLDGGPSGTGTSVSVSAEGNWTLRFRSTDNAGNQETERTAGFAVEIAPTLSAISSATHPDQNEWYGEAGIEASWTGSDSSGIAGYAVVLDQAPGTVPGNVTQTVATYSATVASGEWYLHVRARDTRGNWSQTEHRRFRVDTGLPTLSPLASTSHPDPDVWYPTRGLAASWSASDDSGIAGYAVVLDQNASTVPATTITQSGNSFAATLPADGVWYLHVRARDNVGSWSGAQRRAFRADTAPPVTTSNATASYTGSATITLTPTDPAPGSGVATTHWSLDGGPSGTGTTVNASAEGDWTLRFYSIDSAGNQETERTATFAVEIPPAAPAISSATHPVPGTAYPLADFSASWTVPDADVTGYAVAFDTAPGTVPTTVTQTGTTFVQTIPRGATRYLHVRARDARGNWGPTAHFAVTVAPLVSSRIAGADRITTAIEASKVAFPTGAPTVVIATARNWPDALGGAALAGAVGGPILLTEPGALPASVSAEITRLGATKAIVLGGTGAVSPAVETALKTKLGAANVDRVAGADRYETARKVAAETVARAGTFDGTAFVANGANFPDALAASPLAAFKRWPIYLVRPTGVDDALVAAMNVAGVNKVVILGGTGAVPTAVENALKTRVPGAYTRLDGTDRYVTARKVAAYGVSNAGLSWDKVAVATGANFPDALAGGVLQAKAGSVMLLTPSAALHEGVRQTLVANRGVIWEIRFLGGTSAVSEAVRNAAVAALQ